MEKCQRCGKPICDADEKGHEVIMSINMTKYGYGFSAVKYTLCPKCWHEVLEFVGHCEDE